MRLRKFGYAIWLAMSLFIFAADMFAQTDYEMTLTPRRLGNQLGVEIWVKTTNPDALPLGDMNIGVAYNGAKLTATDFSVPNQPSSKTDAVQYDVDAAAPLPYYTITSPFHSSAANGFSALSGNRLTGSVTGTTRYIAVLNVNATDDGTGYMPASTGKGTFIGLMRFDIIDAGQLTDTDMANFIFNPYTTLSTNKVMAGTGSTDVTSLVNFVNPSAFAIRGITVLNPNQLNQTVNRYPEVPYLSMGTNHGYPIYFERSGLATVSAANTYGTTRFAYKLEYSLNSGSSYNEFGRVAESRMSALAIADADKEKYRTGWVDSLDATTDYFITTGLGTVIPADVASGSLLDDPAGPGLSNVGFGGILRVIWKGDDNFPYRSETAKIRISQIDTLPAAASLAETSRETLTDATRLDESDQTFVLGRLFFTQLNGTSSYLRSERNFSTPNAFTVEAWVNLNTIKADGSEPGIVVTSSGPASIEEGGWMLYLKDGKYPAFRARKAGGADGEYLGTVVSPVALTAFDPNAPLSDLHAKNWSHIAASVNNNVVTLYVDGELMDQYTNKSAVNVRAMNTKMPVWVGVNPNKEFKTENYYHGGIKEVKIWRYAMPQDELRSRISGVYDPNGAVTPLTDLPNDSRTALELYYTMQGSRSDVANNKEFQQSANQLNYFLGSSFTDTPQNELISFRPDRSHIKLTAPTGNEGISNLKGKTFDVRWVAFGVGKPNTKTSATNGDVMVQISRDGGNTWFDAMNNDVPALPLDNEEVEAGKATWAPYNNATITGTMNDLQGVLDITGNYNKTVILRVSGTESRNQEAISATSPAFLVAPNFAFKNTPTAHLTVKGTQNLNITSTTAYFEAWINPYSFPENTEGNYYPILSKMDPNAANEADALHYAFRLLPSGQLQFAMSTTNDAGGKEVRTAVSDPIYRILKPNQTEFDSVWVHVGVWVSLPENGTQSEVIFYVDGTPQEEWFNNTTLEATNPIKNQLGSGIVVDKYNEFPAYLGYEPGLSGVAGKSFDGEFKEIRFWGGNPGGFSTSADRTAFIQGALTVRANEFGTFSGDDYAKNLLAAYIFNGGGWINNGYARSVAVYPLTNDLLGLVADATNVTFASTTPFIKIVEPKYLQAVKNEDDALTVRWVGFDYNRNDVTTFYAGNASKNADLRFSTQGGGGEINVPYQYVASTKHNPGYTNAVTLTSANKYYEFPGTSSKSQFALALNCAITDPDENKDGTYTDQSPIGAAMTNGRLELRARAFINTPAALEYDNDANGVIPTLLSESPQFNITPPSNFTIRLLLEGYHTGSATGIANNIGDKYSNRGVRIRLFENNSGRPGAYVENSTAVSSDKYADWTQSKDVANRNGGNNNFANIPFVFTDVNDGRYFVVVDHLNYLPVMSQFAAPFYYAGDNSNTWSVESGWDFQGWTGVTNSLITSTDAAAEPPVMGTSFSAFADESNYVSDRSDSKWALTGLNYSNGSTDIAQGTALAALVGGDVQRDGMITAGDRSLARVNASSTSEIYDINGDGFNNSIDRTIVDNNMNKVSSLRNLSLQADYIYPASAGIIKSDRNLPYVSDADPMTVIAPEAPELSYKLIAAAKEYIENGGERTHKSAPIKANVTLGGIEYKVTATPYISGDVVEVPMYIQNAGPDFAMGNATFAITYDPNVVTFKEHVNANNVIFSERSDMGYDKSYTAPTNITKNPLANTRSIEIDYDAFTKKSGQIVPTSSTYLGTLRFNLIRKDESVFFSWSPSVAVLATDGRDLTADGKFEVIKPIIVAKTFAVTSPNGGEVWEGGSFNSITWTNPNSDVKVFVEYSSDKGSSWNRVVTNPYDAASLSYNWITPRVNSSECLVRLINASTGLEIDRSDALFSLQSAPAEISRPASTDAVYTSGKKDYIRWTAKDKANVKFEYSENGVNGWRAVTGIVNSELGQTEWTLPSANTKHAAVRMVNAQTGEVIAVSEPFRILSGSLTITSPRTNDKVKYGEMRTVRWAYDNVNTYTLQFSNNGGSTWETVSTDIKASTKAFTWAVPNVTTKNAVLRAIYNNDPDLEYNRTGAFSVDGVSDVNDPAALGYYLAEVSPNPVRSNAAISFTLPIESNVNIVVYNSAGAQVAVIANNQYFATGTSIVNFDASTLAAGAYSIRLETGKVTLNREVVIVK